MNQSQEELEDMMNEMDTDGDGDIGFEEFAVAIQHTYDDDMITQAAEVRLGFLLVEMYTDSILANTSKMNIAAFDRPKLVRWERACGIVARSFGASTATLSLWVSHAYDVCVNAYMI